MPWKFDPFTMNLVFESNRIGENADYDFSFINFDEREFSDLALDTGERLNSSALFDNGLRIVDGNL